MRRDPLKQKAGFTLIELMVVVAVLSLVAAIAVPNYLRYMAKARQAEAKTNLGGIFVSQSAYFIEYSVYGTFTDVGFEVAGNSNRYAYRVGAGATAGIDLLLPGPGMPADPGDNTIVGAGISSFPNAGFTATATANIDSDGAIDMWHVNDRKQGLVVADTNDSIG